MAETYQSVSFTPHITLSGTPNWERNRIEKAIEEIADETQPLKLKTTSLRCSSNPYQKMTHGIQKTPRLSSLHQKTDAAFKGDYTKKAYPHISYLYSRLECSAISHEIKQAEKEAPQEILANRLALIRCKGTPEAWKTLTIWELND